VFIFSSESEKPFAYKLVTFALTIGLAIYGFFQIGIFVSGRWDKWFPPKETEPPTTEAPITTTEPVRFNKGEIIKFGELNGERIEWIVLATSLENEGEVALIITKYLIESGEFDSSGGTRWGSCSLRMGLNDDHVFYRLFSDGERARIIKTQITTPGSATTKDLIFLLTANEIKYYFGSNYYAYYKEDENNAAYWWTRSPSYDENENAVGISIISNDSDVFSYYAEANDDKVGIRPAMWIKAN